MASLLMPNDTSGMDSVELGKALRTLSVLRIQGLGMIVRRSGNGEWGGLGLNTF